MKRDGRPHHCRPGCRVVTWCGVGSTFRVFLPIAGSARLFTDATDRRHGIFTSPRHAPCTVTSANPRGRGDERRDDSSHSGGRPHHGHHVPVSYTHLTLPTNRE